MSTSPRKNKSPWLASLSDFIQTKAFKVIFFVGLAFIAFQYVFITRFPIGDDPAVHIANAKFTAYSQIFSRNYPVPISIFKALGHFSHIDYIVLFCICISFYFFLSTISFYKFAKLTDKENIIPLIATIIFIGGRWTNDALRMGLLAEVFGWSILFAALYYLAKEKLPQLLIFTLLLLFSHPFAFFIYSLIFFFYLIIHLFTNTITRTFLLKYLGIIAVSALLFLAIRPELLNKFTDFTNKDAQDWGERSLWIIFTTDSKRRLITAFFAVAGLIISIKNWKEPAIKISYLLLFVGLFMSLNQIFGIHFLPFRFYPYLEMGIAIFAAIGIRHIITSAIPKLTHPALAILLATIIITLPNFYFNEKYLLWQSRNASANAIMTPDDQAALKWIKTETKPNARFAAPHRWALWIDAYSEKKHIFDNNTPFSEIAISGYLGSGKQFNIDYIYYPSNYQVPPTILKDWVVAYQQNGVRIYEKVKPIKHKK